MLRCIFCGQIIEEWDSYKIVGDYAAHDRHIEANGERWRQIVLDIAPEAQGVVSGAEPSSDE